MHIKMYDNPVGNNKQLRDLAAAAGAEDMNEDFHAQIEDGEAGSFEQYEPEPIPLQSQEENALPGV